MLCKKNFINEKEKITSPNEFYEKQNAIFIIYF